MSGFRLNVFLFNFFFKASGFQTVKFGLHGERVPRAKISGLFSVCAKFFDRPISAQVFRPICCVTRPVFKKRLANFASAQNGAVSIQSL